MLTIPPNLRGAFDQRHQTLGGERWLKGALEIRRKCPSSGPSRAVRVSKPGVLGMGSAPAERRGPWVVHQNGAEQTSNTARGTPKVRRTCGSKDRWAAVLSGIAVLLRRREMPQPAGPTDPGVPRALGLFPRAHQSEMTRAHPRRENDGGWVK